jgi:chromosome segregation ATPase
MKMTELRAENESLKQQIQLLSQQKEGQTDTAAIVQLKEKNSSLRKSIKDLKAEKVSLSKKNQILEKDISSKEQEQQILKAEFERIQQQLSELSAVHASTIAEFEKLRVEQDALQEKASQLPVIQAELDRLQQVENTCNEKTAQVVELQAQLEQHSQLLEEVREKATQAAAEHQNQLAKVNNEAEIVRSGLQAELDAQRQQSEAQITSLQAEKDGLSTKTSELTSKLKLVATLLEKQLGEKRKITSQYEASVKENQTYKEKSEKQINDLMALLKKMAAELDVSRGAHPTQGEQPSAANADKPASLVNAPATEKPPQRQLQELHAHLTELDQINATQAHQLAVLSARMKRINHALSTPLGRLFSQLLNLKD